MTRPIAQAVLSVKVDGRELAARWSPYLLSMTISKEGSGKSDSCEFSFDDADGQIELPGEGARVEVSLSWQDGGQAVTFTGKTDEPTCEIARGGGMTLSINASAVDMKGKAKQKRDKHKDDATLKEAAESFAEGAGLTVKIDADLGGIKRDYWAMTGESFLAWGARIADEVGAIFKVENETAVFVKRGEGKSASGATLPTLRVVRGENLINGRITPRQARQRYKKATVRWYDRKSATIKREDVEIADDGAEATLEETLKSGGKDAAKAKAGSNAAGAKSGKGGGDVTIIGDPTAQPAAPCVIAGWRAGVDGDYKIASVRHTVSRGAGWETSVTLEKPDGEAGKDGRKKAAR